MNEKIIDWKEICAKCKEGEIHPAHCEYFGEPNGCNSPTYGKHPPIYNAAKMRETLSMIVDACSSFHQFIENGLDGHYEAIPNYDDGVDDFLKCVDDAKSALSAPPRNCDVGMANEQAERFHLFCKTHQSGIQGMCSPQCPCKECYDMCHCLIKWSQMPYEEGGAK